MPAPLTVREIMHDDVPVVAPEDRLEDVVRILREHELHGVPVVNAGGRCVGIITESDLVLSGDEADLHLPHYIELFGGIVFLERFKHFEERLRKATAMTAEDVMTHDPMTIEPDATIREAARTIATKRHNRLPVVEHGRYQGVVTRLDVLDALAQAEDEQAE